MEKKLRKSKNKKLGGVCGGLAEYFDVDATWMRLGWAILSICSAAFPGLILYFIFWLIMPEAEE